MQFGFKRCCGPHVCFGKWKWVRFRSNFNEQEAQSLFREQQSPTIQRKHNSKAAQRCNKGLIMTFMNSSSVYNNVKWNPAVSGYQIYALIIQLSPIFVFDLLSKLDVWCHFSVVIWILKHLDLTLRCPQVFFTTVHKVQALLHHTWVRMYILSNLDQSCVMSNKEERSRLGTAERSVCSRLQRLRGSSFTGTDKSLFEIM